jgi:hypothetical protein
MATRFVAPFEIQPIPKYVRDELERRERDIGVNFISNTIASWDENGNWNTYKGPMRCWVRVCSNGIGEVKYGSKEGFVMSGATGFYKDYGIDPSDYSKTQTVLGYTPSGQPHQIDNEYTIDSKAISKHVPPPGIISIDATMQKSMYRQVTIKWKCFSKDHLNYMTPYFMSPGVSTFIEWGWNHYNPKCLLDLNNVGQPAKMKDSVDDKTPGPSGDPNDPRKTEGTGLLGIYTDPLQQQLLIEDGKGTYELTCGIITSFDYSLQPDGSYDCTTEIKSNSFIYSGVQTRSNALASTSPADNKGNKKPEPVKSFKEYIDTSFKSIPKTVLTGLNSKDPLFPTPVNLPGPETRVFIPRNLDTSNDPRTKVDNVTKYSFDSGATDDFWITMGLFIDLINKFFAAESPKVGATFNQIDISSSWIGGHKNLISTDGKILLIPNSQAPNISPSVEDRGKSTNYTTPDTQKDGKDAAAISEADKTLQSLFNSTTRQDLNEIINYFRIKYSGKDPAEVEFPAKQYDYNLGKLENLYVHKDVILKAVEKSETVTDILNFVLNKVSEAVNGMWKFSLIQYGPSNSLLSIIDTECFSLKRLQELNSDKRPYIYFFKNRASRNNIQSLNFSVKLSDKVATTVLYNSPKDNKTSVPMKNPFGFVTRDRFFQLTNDDSYLTPKDKEAVLKANQNTELERQREDKKRQESIQKERDVKAGAFIVGIVTREGGAEKTYIRKLVLTQKDLFTLLVNDKDPYNSSINSFPQPGIKAEITLTGIAGLKTFQVFGIDNLPEPYDKDILFQVEDVKHSLQSNGTWTTTVTAGIRPTKGLNIST